MQHVPEGVIQAPESPEPRRRCRGVVPFLMMTCAPGDPSALPSRRNQSVQTEYTGNASGHPSVTGTVTRTAVRNFSEYHSSLILPGHHGQ